MNRRENSYKLEPIHFIPVFGVGFYAVEAGWNSATSKERAKRYLCNSAIKLTALSAYNGLLFGAAVLSSIPLAKGLENFLNQ